MSDWLNDGEVKEVSVTRGGDTRSILLPANMPLKEAVKKVASDEGFSAVIVKIDDEQADPANTGNKLLREVGKVEIIPKYVGA